MPPSSSFSRSFGPDLWKDVRPNSIWFHAASTGETRSIIPLARQLRERLHHYPVLITNRSAKALNWPLSASNSDEFARFLAPNEFRVGGFLRICDPVVAVFVESELWPILVHQTRRKGCPMVLVNGRMSDRSYRHWTSNSFSRSLIRSMLQCFNVVHAQSQSDANKLNELGCTSPVLVGNLKLASPSRLSDRLTPDIESFLNRVKPGWAAVSVHPGEEEMIVKAHQLYHEERGLLHGDGASLIIVPRHPSVKEEKIVNLAAKVYRLNAMNIVDPVCGWASKGLGLVFVGGSLSQSSHHGGHNILEPLRSSCKVIHGPHMSSFNDLLNEVPLGRLRFEVDTATEIAKLLHLSEAHGMIGDSELELMNELGQRGDRTVKELCNVIASLVVPLNEHSCD